MSPELTTILMILSLFVLLAGFPIALGVGTVGLVFGLLTSGQSYLYMIPMRVIDGTPFRIHSGGGSAVHIHGDHDADQRRGGARLRGFYTNGWAA